MRIDWDVPIAMDDGVVLRADVFRPPEEGRCDFDGQVDGSCTFGFFCLEVCGPEPRETVVVPVGETRVVQRPNLPGLDRTEYTLRCLP